MTTEALKMADYDPKLKAAAEELKAVLRKYDVAGTLTLHSETHGEFVLHLPSWCGAVMKDNNAVCIRLLASEPAKANATMGVLLGTRDVLGMLYLQFDHLTQLAVAEIEAQGGTVDHEPLRGLTVEQN